LTQETFESTIRDCSSQLVIYGANGWMGRSAIDYLSFVVPKIPKERVLLIGSKPSRIEVNNEIFDVVESNIGFELIRENAIFLNSAFLRREALQSMTSEAYLIKNKEIVSFYKICYSSFKVCLIYITDNFNIS
jgi:hypothetical protein